MTQEELDAVADSANSAFGSASGFRGCSVRSYEPAVLSFELESPNDAQSLKAHFELMSSPYRHEIDPKNRRVLLEYL